MKTKYIITTIIVLFISSWSFGQESNKKTENVAFKVSGLCGMCKERIENAALIKGVKFADWNKETEIITLVYNPQKVNIDAIHQSIATAGHDTDKIKADDKDYKELPRCCAYRDSNNKH